MNTHLNRFALALVFVLLLLVASTPLGQAQGNGGRPPGPNITRPDVSSQAAVELYVKQHPASTTAADEIRASIRLTPDGFATTNPKFAPSVKEVNTGLQGYRRLQAQSASPFGTLQAQAMNCVYLPPWVWHAYIWYVVISGGVWATMGLFVSLTIVGIPLGAVLAAVGIWYGIWAWVCDQLFSEWGFYAHGAWICY